MQEIKRSNIPINEVSDNPFNQETNAQSMFDFITNRHCKEAEEFHDGLIKGCNNLIYQTVPGYSDQKVLIPQDISPKFYKTEWDKRVKQWVGIKKKAVDRLLDIDTDKAANLLGTFCGYEVNFHIRKGLINKRPEYHSFIEQEVKKIADNMGLSKNIFVRKLQEEKIQKQMMNSNDHLDLSAKCKYYFDLKTLLKK
jgi:hypothetical protein